MAGKNEYIRQIDMAIGRKIRRLRFWLGLSRQQVTVKIGMTHRQLQRYESAKDCLSAGRLAAIAKVLNKPASSVNARPIRLIPIAERF